METGDQESKFWKRVVLAFLIGAAIIAAWAWIETH